MARSNWIRLSEELDHWGREGRTANFWWRDDDCVEPTPALDRLLDCAGATPIALAVIPGRVSAALGERLRGYASVSVLQHGWRHVSHVDGAMSEYPGFRSDEDVLSEFIAGRQILSDLFGSQYLPVFAPPFHGFDDRFLSLFPTSGLKMLSRKGPRSALRIAGELQLNCHCAPIVWSAPPSFGDERAHLEVLIDHLQGRRTGRYDAREPTGLLSHHLDQDDASFGFMAELNHLVSEHPAAAWVALMDVEPALAG